MHRTSGGATAKEKAGPSLPEGLPAFFREMLLALALDDFFAAIETRGRNVVAQMGFTGSRLNRQGGSRQKIMSANHATLGRGLLVLLNSHFKLLK